MSTTSSTLRQNLDDGFYRPQPQNHWIHNGTTWISAASPLSSSIQHLSSSKVETPINPKSLRLLSWNIDMQQDNAELRMARAIEHLHTLVTSTPTSTPIVIFLQEMLRSDLAQLESTSWIQQAFSMTELPEQRSWQASTYGTATLVDRRLQIASVFRVPFISKFGRDGLFVDIKLTARDTSKTEEEAVLRLCNTHLESLVAHPPVRPLQLASASSYMYAPSPPTVAAAILAGDLNAIEPFDRTLHTTHNLQDLYLSLGGKEDSDDGYTWGYQVPEFVRQRFGCSRMDKILFKGDVRGVAFERFGAGVVVEGREGEEMRARGQHVWVTDHYGVRGDFEMVGPWELCGDGKGVDEGTLESKWV